MRSPINVEQMFSWKPNVLYEYQLPIVWELLNVYIHRQPV